MKTEVLKTYQDFKEFHSKVKKKNLRQLIVFLITFRFPIESSQEIVDNLQLRSSADKWDSCFD